MLRTKTVCNHLHINDDCHLFLFCRIGSVQFKMSRSVKTWYCQHYRCEHCVLGNTGLLEDHGINACGTCGVDTSCEDCSGLAHGSRIVDTCGNCLLPEDPTFNTGKNVRDWLAGKRCSNGTLLILLFFYLAEQLIGGVHLSVCLFEKSQPSEVTH